MVNRLSKIHLVIPDSHANPEFHNERATWLGQFILDIKPDVVINMGDGADMPSLCSYDKGKRSYHGRTYRRDINSHLDFQERLWSPIKKAKKRLPESYYLIGNHEQRILRAIDLSPELEGTISIDDLNLREWYDQVVPYDGTTPGTIEVDGIHYAHYFVSGVLGRPIGGEHPAHALLTKRFVSSTCGHVHTADYCVRTDGSGRKIMSSVVGCYQDYHSDWAGVVNDLWWRGVLLKTNVDSGTYDAHWISIDTLRDQYDVRR